MNLSSHSPLKILPRKQRQIYPLMLTDQVVYQRIAQPPGGKGFKLLQQRPLRSLFSNHERVGVDNLFHGAAEAVEVEVVALLGVHVYSIAGINGARGYLVDIVGENILKGAVYGSAGIEREGYENGVEVFAVGGDSIGVDLDGYGFDLVAAKQSVVYQILPDQTNPFAKHFGIAEMKCLAERLVVGKQAFANRDAKDNPRFS